MNATPTAGAELDAPQTLVGATFIAATIAPKVGFASHQNAVPVLRDLVLRNPGAEPLDGLTLTLEADPPFLEPKVWRFDRLAPGDSIRVADRDVALRGGYLADLGEGLRGRAVLTLARGDAVLEAHAAPVEVLARAEWGGAAAMPELLAAFVLPNDPAVDRGLKAASDVLRRAGKRDAIDGYESGSRSRVWELASAMWSAVAGLGLSYALPPASFETEGQKVRTPSAIAEGGIATCLDTALLFAAMFEQAGLNPLLVLTRGHAFAGVWLQPQEFAALITDEAAAVRKRIELSELLLFETTLVTSKPAVAFSKAVAEGRRQVAEDCEDAFVFALDLRRARMQRIRPLPVPGAASGTEGADMPAAVAEALEEAPVLPAFDVPAEEAARGAETRIDVWQRKLLDLTTRNRLLHLPDSAKAIRFACPDPAALEDRLARGGRVRIAAVPNLEAGGRDAALHRERTREDLLEAYGREALARGELLALGEATALDAALTDLFRKARSDAAESGANTLFLAAGFLKWKKAAADPRVYRAPLVLLPVVLDRRSAGSGFHLLRHEDEPRFNLTLLELLRQDFELSIPGLDGPLPGDEDGVDLAAVWEIVRRAVRDVPGFEVVTDLVLGTFSFAKYLMWKDLAERTDALKANPVVRHLLEKSDEPFAVGHAFPRLEELDRTIDPAGLFAPLPADSSQLAAVVASAGGASFVLDGPPGTGKSQTIANMIAHNLALGRKVLFVAEKRAALEVVHRRMAERGLGEFCLELHSSKASKVEVLKQLDRAWDVREALSEEQWQREAADLARLRARLNEVVRLLHEPHPNGLTLHQAMGRVIRDGGPETPRLGWPAGQRHDRDELDRMRAAVRRLALNRAGVSDLPAAFAPIAQTDWSNGWQEAFVAAARELAEAADAVRAARDALLEQTGLPLAAATPDALKGLGALAGLLLEAYGVDLRFAFAPDAPERIAAVRHGLALVADYRAEAAAVSVPYAPEAVRRIDVGAVQAAWDAAGQRFWPLNAWAKRGISRDLGRQAGTVARPDPAADLPRLRVMRERLEALDALRAVEGVPGWAGLSSDPARAVAACDLAERLRGAIAAAAGTPDRLAELRRAVAALAIDANELLAPDGGIAMAARLFAERHTAFADALGRFEALGRFDAPGESRGGLPIAELVADARLVQAQQARLKAWCDWRRARADALALGLEPLVARVEEDLPGPDAAADLFETAYARWFAGWAIDAEPALRGFVSAEHMSDIEAFRRADDRLSALVVRYIRAKLCGAIPSKNEVSRASGYGMLKHELNKQKLHKPIRQLAEAMGEALTTLAPCMLMSPLSIAQYLPPDAALFDLVIFDEASQIAPWDAVGSIARGRQVVVAGDPRQMPPTSFFNRAAAETDDDIEEDMESILDSCLAAGIPQHRLSWHYRSRHESLIAFSNHRYYEGELITFPAAVTRETAVSWRHVPGVYAKGKGRTNQAEAEAMVAETVSRLRDPAFTMAERSIALVTLNAEQQKLVEDLLDKERARLPEIERFFGDDRLEPVVVKNLETVQGDERDLVMLGIGYGPTEPGARAMSMNFGPLNRDGGWRRLNVAITRARREMLVFSSFDPHMIDLNRTGARAVRDLKHFLEFAERGPRALAEAVAGSVGAAESPFEEAVARGLRERGWSVVPQIGVSRFRIDLGIVHPDRPGDYLAGIECDGAAYHSAPTARDRDKVRAAILEGLGWRLLRVWSTDWWVDRAGALARLDGELRRLLADDRAAVERAATLPLDLDGLADVTEAESPPDAPAAATETRIARSPEPVSPESVSPESIPPAASLYRTATFEGFPGRIDPQQFYDPLYTPVIEAMVAHVLACEAPIRDSLLVQRIARAHGFQRAGRIIRERVLAAAVLRHHLAAAPDGDFVWPDADAPARWSGYRVPDPAEEPRPIEAIAPEELRDAARAITARPVRGDRALAVARLFGARGLSPAARRRIEAVLPPPGKAG